MNQMKRPLKTVQGAVAGLFIMVFATVTSARSSDGAAEPITTFVVSLTAVVMVVGLSLMINRRQKNGSA